MYACLPEDSSDLVVEAFSTVADVKNLQSFFNCHTALEGLVIHQELHEVEQLAGLQASLI